ncbi:hypothetical protein [Streptomyces sp. 2A115]|uniref:hypothetical protein n=1 Tax=Streptomyces sp. 2A115 TaxID=3457439 RepID=UPI003FD4660D
MARHGLGTGAAGRWLGTQGSWTTGLVIAGGGLAALVLWNCSTPGAVALVLGIVVLVPALLGILAAATDTAQRPPVGDRPDVRPG